MLFTVELDVDETWADAERLHDVGHVGKAPETTLVLRLGARDHLRADADAGIEHVEVLADLHRVDLLLAKLSGDKCDCSIDVDGNLELACDHVSGAHGNDGQWDRCPAQSGKNTRDSAIAATSDDEIEVLRVLVDELLRLLLASGFLDLVGDSRGLELAAQRSLDGRVVALAFTQYDECFHGSEGGGPRVVM